MQPSGDDLNLPRLPPTLEEGEGGRRPRNGKRWKMLKVETAKVTAASNFQFGVGGKMAQPLSPVMSPLRGPAKPPQQVSIRIPEEIPEELADKRENFGALARELIERCGSLERAFTTFDYNNQHKVTRAQWETGVMLLRLDIDDVCGISSKKLFKLMDASDTSTDKGQVTLEGWTSFFRGAFEGTEDASLLTKSEGEGSYFDRKASYLERKSLNRDFMQDVLRKFKAKKGISGASADPGAEDPADSGSGEMHDTNADSGDSHGDDAPCVDSDSSDTGSDSEEEGQSSEVGDDDSDVPGSDSGDADEEDGGSEEEEEEEGDEEESGTDSDTDEGPGIHRTRSKRKTVRLAPDGCTSLQFTEPDTPVPEAHVPSAPSPKVPMLPEAPSGISLEALRKLDDAGLDAIAEQEQLQEEIKEMDLTGVRALAYVFINKKGSLRKTFQYIDAANTGKFGRAIWDSCMLLLHVDMQKLTGLTIQDVFHMMDRDPNNGLVTYKKWSRFFHDVEKGSMPVRAGSKGGSTLAERAQSKKAALLARLKKAKNAKRYASGGACSSTAGAESDADGLDGNPQEALDPDDGDAGQASGQQRGGGQGGSAFALSSVAARGGRGGIKDTAGAKSDDETWEPGAAARAFEEIFGKLTPEERDFRRKITKQMCALGPGESHEYGAGLNTRKVAIVQFVADDLGLWSLRRIGPGKHLVCNPKDYEEHMDFGNDPPPAGGILVANLKDFADRTREIVAGIEVGGHHDFPPELSELQRGVVHVLSAEIQLMTFSEGAGSDRYVTAFNMNDFADQIREVLLELEVGDKKVFTDDFTAAQRKIVRAIASELSLRVKSSADGTGPIEVYNVPDFGSFVRQALEGLGDGEEILFPDWMSEQEKEFLRAFAKGKNFSSLLQSAGLCVGNLIKFSAESREILQMLAPGDSHTFSGVTALQRNVLQTIASELALHSEGCGEHDTAPVTITRPHGHRAGSKNRMSDQGAGAGHDANGRDGASGNAGGDGTNGRLDGADLVSDQGGMQAAAEADVESSSDESDSSLSDDESSIESIVSKLFFAYSTGKYKGERVFLRFPDLGKFADDVRDSMPRNYKTFKQFESVLENTFDDTLQLQIDMGTRTNHGLTLKWFQVFIQKSMRKLGTQVVVLLTALLEDI